MNKKKFTKLLALYLPYLVIGLAATNLGEAWRLAEGKELGDKIVSLMGTLPAAFANPLPSLHPLDILVGICCGAGLRLAVYLKSKNAKKYRHGMEYGSARWGTPADIAPFMAPKFEDNIILTKTERLMMSNRPPDPKNARNKNVLVVGGSGSGKTRYFIKPNLLQCTSKSHPVSFVVTDPKGGLIQECGLALLKNGYKIRTMNTINFHKSMRYNPFAYIHEEKDILKLVTTLMTNTKGEGQGGDPFWDKAERLLLTSLIAYLHYEAPAEEQNFATLLEMLNTMQVSEEDEDYQNPVDLLFEDLALPNLKQNQQRQLTEYKTHRAGYTANGVPANISVVRSLQNSLARRTAMTAGKRRELHALEENLAIISNSEPAQLLEEERLRKEIAELRAKIERVPFIDTFDLRYKNYEKRPDPSSQAVMFCLMDVSGSMDQSTKDMAKRFYILLYLFLSRTYKNVEVVYIRHHTQAKEVDEHEFFYSQETGGTIVSSALKLMDEVVKERYNPAQWNIYAAWRSCRTMSTIITATGAVRPFARWRLRPSTS